MDRPDRVQLHLALPFHQQPKEHPRISALLARGWVVVDLQRLTDKEVSVTLERAVSQSA